MINRRILLGLLAGAGLVGISSAATWSAFSSTLAFHRARVSRGSETIPSRFGQVEYAKAGSGPPILMIHGAGGGFDQGIAFTEKLISAGYQVIAPSRFGYLRSQNPDNPSPENQADAFADLLDGLQIPKADVIGVSAGTISALHFAARYPQRCRSLAIVVPAVSVAGTSGQTLAPAMDPLSLAFLERMTRSDFLFWLGATVARDRMIRSILATDPALVAAASPAEQESVERLLWNILPISARAQGLINDSRYPGIPQQIAFDRIKAPTLVVSLEDDFYGTIVPARIVAEKIAGARLLTYPTGGHAFVGREEEFFAEMSNFLKKAGPPLT